MGSAGASSKLLLLRLPNLASLLSLPQELIPKALNSVQSWLPREAFPICDGPWNLYFKDITQPPPGYVTYSFCPWGTHTEDYFVVVVVFFLYFFLLDFDLPTYSITCACPIKCPPQHPSPSHPILLPTFPSTTPCSFPRVRSLSCFVTLYKMSGKNSATPE